MSAWHECISRAPTDTRGIMGPIYSCKRYHVQYTCSSCRQNWNNIFQCELFPRNASPVCIVLSDSCTSANGMRWNNSWLLFRQKATISDHVATDMPIKSWQCQIKGLELSTACSGENICVPQCLCCEFDVHFQDLFSFSQKVLLEEKTVCGVKLLFMYWHLFFFLVMPMFIIGNFQLAGFLWPS